MIKIKINLNIGKIKDGINFIDFIEMYNLFMIKFIYS